MLGFASGARVARAVASVTVLAVLLAGCPKHGKDERDAFCNKAEDVGASGLVDPFRNISGAATPEELQQLLDTSEESFRTLAEDASPEIRPQFDTLIEGIGAYRDLVEGSGFDVAAVDQAALAELQQQYQAASDSVNTFMKRCDIDTGAGGPATTAAQSSTTG